MLERCIAGEGYAVKSVQDGQEAIDYLEAGEPLDLILTDLDMPRADGRMVLAAGMKRRIPVVILTGNGTVAVAVELMRQGAANFLTKPFSPPSLRAVLADAFGAAQAAQTQAAPPAAAGAAAAVARAKPAGDRGLIGEDGALKQVLSVLESVAETDATVLVTGESGTGKEVVARAIHRASPRARAPFVAVNCGAIPEPLLESELFGHARGAFTGATQSRAGRFALAEGGTLFLDEIGDMPLGFQVKLLRVLQERQYEVLGDSQTRKSDVRVICATHRDLRRQVAEGKFREDLFYRVNVIELELPPLRDRRGDIPLLVEHFLDAANQRHQRAVAGLHPDAMAALVRYAWPGNVRELANVIERAVVLRRSGEIGVGDLPQQVTSGGAPARGGAVSQLPEGGIDLRQVLAEFEESLIDQALTRTGGNRNAAAALLGLNRTTLVEKLKRKGT